MVRGPHVVIEICLYDPSKNNTTTTTPWRYNPFRILASLMMLFHSCLSLAFVLNLLTFILRKSSSTSSNHLSLGLPILLLPPALPLKSFLSILFSSILITCPSQEILLLFSLVSAFSQKNKTYKMGLRVCVCVSVCVCLCTVLFPP